MFTEQEQVEAKQAREWWEAKEYDRCGEALIKLKQMKQDAKNDTRVMVNNALVFYKKSGKENRIQELKNQLNKALNSVQTPNSNNFSQEANFNHIFYNMTLISYMLHQINDIEKATEKTLSEPIDSLIKVKCCLLAAQSFIQLHNFDAAEKIFEKLEKMKKEEENKEGGAKAYRMVFNPEEQLSLEASERVWRMVEWQRCVWKASGEGEGFKKQLKEFKRHNRRDSSVANRHQVAFLKAMYEHSQGKLMKSFELMSSELHRRDNGLETLNNNLHHHYKALYHNNTSIVLFGMGKFAMASQHLRSSVIENKSYLTAACTNNTKNGGNKNGKNLQQVKPLHVISKNRKLKIMYNYGVTLLHHGFSNHAFDFLVQAAQLYYDNPKLWLRLAECCIQKCTGCGKDESKASSKKSPTLMYNTHQEIGSGIHRKIQIKPINNYLSNSKHNFSFSSNPTPSMEFAMICLRNALSIIRKKLNGDLTDKDEFAYDLHNTTVQCQPSSPVRGKQLVQLVSDVLCNSAYVSLHLGDACNALMFAKYVLSIKDVSPMHRYLASTYAAEAQVSVDEVLQAISYLDVSNIGNIDHFFKPANNGNGKNNSEPKEKDPHRIRRRVWEMRNSQIPWHLPDTLLKARSYMKFNLAVVLATRSTHESAISTLLEAWEGNTEMLPPHAVLLSAYLNLHLHKDGKGCDKALQVLLQHKLEPDPLGCPYSHTKEMSSVGYKLHVPLITNKDQGQRSKSVTPAVSAGGGQQQGKDEGKQKKGKTRKR